MTENAIPKQIVGAAFGMEEASTSTMPPELRLRRSQIFKKLEQLVIDIQDFFHPDDHAKPVWP
jgi:hypothetical protein